MKFIINNKFLKLAATLIGFYDYKKNVTNLS